MSNKKNNKQTTTIEMIEKRHDFTADIIQKAAEKHQRESEEKKIKEIMSIFEQIDHIESQQVAELRMIREQEKRQKARLLALNKAKEEFIQTADVDQLRDALLEIGLRIVRVD